MDLISKIYHKIICNNEIYSPESEVVNEIICKLIEDYKDKMILEDKESFEELLYSLVLASEEYGFLLGMKFLVALLDEIRIKQ